MTQPHPNQDILDRDHRGRANSRQASFARPRRLSGDSGQTTAEYALVLLGVAAIAMMVLAWAGQTDAIARLFDAVLNSILGLVP